MVDESGGNSARDFCSTTFKEWNVNHIFIMPYNVSAIVSCANGASDDNLLLCNRNTAMRNISLQAVDYLYSLDGYTGVYDENATVKHYRIVIEYKVDSKAKDYSYFDYETDGPCPTGQTKDPITGKCKVSITTSKYYYSTLEVPFGNSNAVT